jgi:hypothetical protein
MPSSAPTPPVAIQLANEGGKVSADQLHETLLVLLHSNFAAVATTDAWTAASPPVKHYQERSGHLHHAGPRRLWSLTTAGPGTLECPAGDQDRRAQPNDARTDRTVWTSVGRWMRCRT